MVGIQNFMKDPHQEKNVRNAREARRAASYSAGGAVGDKCTANAFGRAMRWNSAAATIGVDREGVTAEQKIAGGDPSSSGISTEFRPEHSAWLGETAAQSEQGLPCSWESPGMPWADAQDLAWKASSMRQ